jgi:ribosomal protein S18 acetylase RimI-like enzyme
MNIREITSQEIPVWAEYCEREWEHGGVIAPITTVDIEKPFPEDVKRFFLLAEIKGDIAAGFSLTLGINHHIGAYGCKYWLDMWVTSQWRNGIEEEIIQYCDTIMADKGITACSCRVPDYTSRFTDLFKRAGYAEKYKEDTFIRETKKELDKRFYSYYEQTTQSVDIRVSKNLKEDMETYVGLVNQLSDEVDNITSLQMDHLHSTMFDGKRHMIGIWIFAEVDKTPAGFIGALVGLQKLYGKTQIVGNILNNGVSKDFRGMGIGTALYYKMLEEMKKWNTAYILDYMVMEDNAPERGLLQELGFEPAQKHILLEKTIS